MRRETVHPSDERLICAIDRELAPADLADVERHLAACPACLERAEALGAASASFAHAYLRAPALGATPKAFALARLKARAAEQDAPARRAPWLALSGRSLAMAFVAVLVVIAGLRFGSNWTHQRDFQAGLGMVSAPLVPDAKLTPGAVRSIDASALCRAGGPPEARPPAYLRQAVFHEYGMDGAAPEGYEVDHLITPALGGSDDIRNLWPESYSSEWNAHVKDELEDYLRNEVCAGKIDLPIAQREIATNWITAYQRYFHTNRPLHRNSAVIPKRNPGFRG